MDRADEMQIHSLNCTRELEHAQGAIVDLEVVVKEQKFTIMANEQKQFELLSSLNKAGNNQKSLQSRLDASVNTLRDTREQLSEARQKQLEATTAASTATGQLMKHINTAINGTTKEKEENNRLSKDLIMKAFETEVIPAAIAVDENDMPIGGDTAIRQQADGDFEATVKVAGEVAAKLEASGLQQDAKKVDQWRAVTVQWKDITIKWKHQLQKANVEAVELISKLQAEGKHAEAEEVQRLAKTMAIVSKPQAPSVFSYAEREFALADKDNDGSISRNEFIAAYGAERALEFDRVDSNRDGVILMHEFEAAYGTAPQPKAWVHDLKRQELELAHEPVPELKITDPVKMSKISAGVGKLAAVLLSSGCKQPETILKLQNLSSDPNAGGEEVEQAAQEAYALAGQLEKEGKLEEAAEVEKMAQMLDDAVEVVVNPDVAPITADTQAYHQSVQQLRAFGQSEQPGVVHASLGGNRKLRAASNVPDFVAQEVLSALVKEKSSEADKLQEQVSFLKQQLEMLSIAKDADEATHKEEQTKLRQALAATAKRYANTVACETPEDDDLDSRAERLRLEIMMYHNRCIVLEDELQVALDEQARVKEEARTQGTSAQEMLRKSQIIQQQEFAKAVENKVEGLRNALGRAEDKVEKTVTYASKIESALDVAKKALEDAEKRVGLEESHSAELEAALDRARRHFETLQVQTSSLVASDASLSCSCCSSCQYCTLSRDLLQLNLQLRGVLL